jgi:hypothetical protein
VRAAAQHTPLSIVELEELCGALELSSGCM